MQEHGCEIHALMLNAATLNSKPSIPARTTEGLEESFAVNVCASLLLAQELMPAIVPDGRIVVTGSEAGGLVQWKLNPNSLEGEAGMGPGGLTQYARTKVALHACFGELAARLGARVHICVFHPGAVSSSLGNNVSPVLAAVLKSFLWFFFRSAEQGAVLGLHAACAAEPVSGYLNDGEFGTPRDMSVKPIPGAQDVDANTATFQAVERRIRDALAVQVAT